MRDFVRRMVNELDELDTKISKLNKFIESSTFKDLDEEDQDLLERQRVYMDGYRDILDQRINKYV